MKNVNIDVKSLVVGAAIGFGIMFGLGASTGSSSSGRYQITSSGIYLAVLDSETGQVWAGNFIPPAANAAAVFKNCVQGSGDLFHVKSQ